MRVVLTFLINTLFNLVVGLAVARFLGPAEYGKFALAVAVMGFGQTLAFEWVRQCATRFYSEDARRGAPKIRATLDRAFLRSAIVVLPAAALFALLGPEIALPRDLFALACVAAIANGGFDYQTALTRARFDDRLYLKIVVSKNILALVVTIGAAALTGSARAALIAGMISLLGALVLCRGGLADEGLRETHDPALMKTYLGYSAPIVAAVLLYQFIPLANRDLAARLFGFAETGKFALAFDLGQRAVMAIGSALDVLLFQFAVRAQDRDGVAAARAQIARNMAAVFAILAPTCVGLWLTLPSVEALIVPPEFRGPFARFLTLMLPGLFCLGLAQFALNAVFQIARKTWPMAAGAGAACLGDAAFLFFAPRAGRNGADAGFLAIAQSFGFLVGLLALIVFALAAKARFPRARDLALTLAGCAAMAGALWPTRGATPGLGLLLAQILAGGAVYGLVVALFDVAGLRGVALDQFSRLRRKLRPAPELS